MHSPFPSIEAEQAAKAVADRHPLDLQLAWESLPYTKQVNVYYGTHLVVFRWWMGKPQILEILTVLRMKVQGTDGIAVEIKDSNGKERWLSHTPEPIFEDKIFLSVPFCPRIYFLPTAPGFPNRLKYPLVIKSEGSPMIEQEGKVCMMKKGLFDSQFQG